MDLSFFETEVIPKTKPKPKRFNKDLDQDLEKQWKMGYDKLYSKETFK